MTRLPGFPPLTNNAYELPKTVLVRVLAAATLFSWALGQRRDGDGLRVSWWFAPVGIFVGWTGLATLFSHSPATSFLGSHSRLDGFLAVLAYAVIAFTGVQVFSSGREVVSLVRAIVASGFLVSSYGVLQALGIDPAFYFSTPELAEGRVFSTMGNAVFLGGYLVLVLPLALAVGLSDDDSRWRIVGWTTAAASAVAVLATASRTAWIAVVCELFLLGALAVRKRVRPGRMGLAAGAVTVLAATGYVVRSAASAGSTANVGERVASLFSPASGSVLERLIIARAAWRAALERPLLGYGPDRFVVAFRRFRPTQHVELFPQSDYIDNAHSVPLQIASTAGVVAAVAWLVAVAWPLVASFRSAFSTAAGRSRVLFGAVWVAATGFCVYLSAGLSVVAAMSTFWLLLAVLAGSRARAVRAPGDGASGLLAVLAGLALFAAVIHGGTLLVADNRYQASRMYQSGDRVGDPLAAVKQAISLAPQEALYRRDYAQQLYLMGAAEAGGAIDEVLALEPDDAHFLLLKAQLQSRGGNTRASAGLLQQAETLAPTDPLVRSTLAGSGRSP